LSDRRDELAERAREEFFSEASELIETFGRHLLSLDEALGGGSGAEAERLNDIFRSVHTLKGIAGLFGAATLSGLSHELETLLDDLRLGRIQLSGPVVDLLFDAVELYGKILAAQRGDQPEPREAVHSLLASLAAVSNERSGAGGAIAEYELAPETLGVLTEYEEHRLRTNLQGGFRLYRLRAKFPLSSIDTALEELKVRVRPVGEILTYLPTGDGGDLDAIDLEILVASKVSLSELVQAVDSQTVVVEEVRKRDLSAVRTPPAPRVASARHSEFPAAVPTQVNLATIAARGPSGPTPFAEDAVGSDELHHDYASIPPPPPLGTGFAVAAAPPAAEIGQNAPRDLSLRSVSQTVRVDIRKLDRLMNALGELSLVRGALLRYAERLKLAPQTRSLGTEALAIHRAFERQLEHMQGGILEVRMVPLGQIFDKLARIVRQVSREQGKLVQFAVTGAETEIDKLIVEELSDPLLHIVRNALDHGIESASARLELGKPEAGTVALNAYQQGSHVVIEIEDDGRGVEVSRLVAKAVSQGLVSAEDAEGLSKRDALGLIFLAGLSTRDTATELSGRGIGMDIVRNRITKLGGLIELSSDPNIGTKIVLTLPVTLAIVGVLTFEVAGLVYCVPLAAMEEAIQFDERTRFVDGREVTTHRGVTLPIVRLATFFELPECAMEQAKKTAKILRSHGRNRKFLIVARVGLRRIGLVVDALVEQREVVIKSLGGALADIRGFSGATDLGDQRISLILDVADLMDEVRIGGESRNAELGIKRIS
jgi:two-component system, chemotaxis family, sensor kinase CheA